MTPDEEHENESLCRALGFEPHAALTGIGWRWSAGTANSFITPDFSRDVRWLPALLHLATSRGHHVLIGHSFVTLNNKRNGTHVLVPHHQTIQQALRLALLQDLALNQQSENAPPTSDLRNHNLRTYDKACPIDFSKLEQTKPETSQRYPSNHEPPGTPRQTRKQDSQDQ